MEFDELERSVRKLNEVINEFPIGATSLDDFKPIEEKIQTTRESLMRLNARLLLLRAKYKQYTTDERAKPQEEVGDLLQRAISDTLISAKAIKLCLHSATILSVLDNKEGDAEDQKKLYAYMNKLYTLNDNIIAIQESIEKMSLVQLDLKIECQKALFDHKDFLKEQEKIQSQKLQKMHPEILQDKTKVERTIRKINIMKKLIRNFIATSGNMLTTEEPLLKMLEKHRELINVETIAKMSQDGVGTENLNDETT